MTCLFNVSPPQTRSRLRGTASHILSRQAGELIVLRCRVVNEQMFRTRVICSCAVLQLLPGLARYHLVQSAFNIPITFPHLTQVIFLNPVVWELFSFWLSCPDPQQKSQMRPINSAIAYCRRQQLLGAELQQNSSSTVSCAALPPTGKLGSAEQSQFY